MREWKMWHGQNCRSGKCRSGKRHDIAGGKKYRSGIFGIVFERFQELCVFNFELKCDRACFGLEYWMQMTL